MFAVVFVVVLILPLRYSVSEDEVDVPYAPVDTAIISFSHPFCEELRLFSHDSPVYDFPIMSTLYLLQEEPLLQRRHVVSFYRESVLHYQEYSFWKVFLYAGSSVNFSACYMDAEGPWGVFYLVKGDKNFAKWQSHHTDSYIHQERIEAACMDDQNSTYNYMAENEDTYHLIFVSESAVQSTLGISFTFDRVLYSTFNTSIVDKCSIVLNDSSSLECHLDVALSSKATALLELQPLVPDSMIDWDANIVLDVKCDARAWLYVVIAISTVAFIVLLVIVSAMSYFCCCARKNKVSEDVIPREDTSLVRNDDDNNNNNNNASVFYDSCDSAKPE